MNYTPKIQKQVDEIERLVATGEIDSADVDELAKYGINDDAISFYWQKKHLECITSTNNNFVSNENKKLSLFSFKRIALNYKLRKYFKSFYNLPPIKFFRRQLLKIALGLYTYNYMVESISRDNRTKTARMVDIVVRKDGQERRIEADWVKDIARII